MNSRERVLAAARRQMPDRTPMNMWLTPHLIEALRRERRVEDFETYLRMDVRFADYAALPDINDFAQYTTHFHPQAIIDTWGCGTYPVGCYHFTKADCPLKEAVTLQEIEKYPFPRRLPDLPALRQRVAAIQAHGLCAVSQYECGTFEQAHALMGMEDLLALMITEPAVPEALFERVSEVKARMAAAYVEAGVDLLWIGDDIGMQSGPIMSLEMWRRFLLPPLKRILEAARRIRPDIPIAYHSCGAVGFAVDGLIEAGIDILQSVQPEANDCVTLKRRYGKLLAFWGGVGSQSTMSQGTPEDVRREVKARLETLGRHGGYICSPAHFIEPETPLANIDAFVETVEKYGGYDHDSSR